MTFAQFLSFTDIETNKLLITWSSDIAVSRQVDIQQLLSKISKFNIGEYYAVSKENYNQLTEFEVIKQKFLEDGNILIMIE